MRFSPRAFLVEVISLDRVALVRFMESKGYKKVEEFHFDYLFIKEL